MYLGRKQEHLERNNMQRKVLLVVVAVMGVCALGTSELEQKMLDKLAKQSRRMGGGEKTAGVKVEAKQGRERGKPTGGRKVPAAATTCEWPRQQIRKMMKDVYEEAVKQTKQEVKNLLEDWAWEDPVCNPSKEWTADVTTTMIDKIHGHSTEVMEKNAQKTTGDVKAKINSATGIMGVFQGAMGDKFDEVHRAHGQWEKKANLTWVRTREEVVSEVRGVREVVDELKRDHDKNEEEKKKKGEINCILQECPVCQTCAACPEQIEPPPCVAKCPTPAVLTAAEIEAAVKAGLEKPEWRVALTCQLDETEQKMMGKIAKAGEDIKQKASEMEKEEYITKEECVEKGVEAVKAVKECNVEKLIAASEKVNFAARVVCPDEEKMKQEKMTIVAGGCAVMAVMAAMQLCCCCVWCRDQRRIRRFKRNQTEEANNELEMEEYPKNKIVKEKKQQKKNKD